MALSDVVNVTITTQTRGISRVGFGVPLVMGYHTVFPERARVYTRAQDMIDDGFATTALIVEAVRAIFSQRPHPSRVVVGRRANAVTQIIRVTPTAQDTTTYTVLINGTAAVFTSDASATLSEVVVGIVDAINALTEPVTAVAIGGAGTETALDISADVAGTPFTLALSDSLDNRQMDRLETTVANDPVADLLAIQAVNDEWYALIPVEQGEAEAQLLAAEIETQKKILLVASGDSEIFDAAVTTDLFSDLQASSFARTGPMFHTRPHEYPNAAWAGRVLPKTPGGATWALKTLAGVPVDVLSETEQTAIRNKSANFYVELGDRGVVLGKNNGGISSADEFIDVTWGSDDLVSDVQLRLFATLSGADVVPFTRGGISLVERDLRASFQRSTVNGFLAASPEPVFTVPNPDDVDDADKAVRTLPGVEGSGTIAGAIHKVDVSVTVSV